MGDFKNMYEPSKLSKVKEDIPLIKFNPSTNKFSRSGNSKLDSIPTIIKSWYKKNICVRLSTYGGSGEDGGDLACLFYSSGRSILPELANVSYSNNYVSDVHKICHKFKADIATFLLSRTGESHEEIKLRYTLSDSANFNKYFENFTNSKYYIDRGRDELKETFKKAIEIKNQLDSLGVKVDDLEYDRITKGLENFYLDPRERIVKSNITGGLYDQYFWSTELRQLPLDTGLFTIASFFNNSEWDIREEELGENAPTCGDINYTTLIDQLLTKKMYGLDFFRLIANITGFNIFLLTSKGELHSQKCVSRPYTGIGILELTLKKLENPKFQYESLDYNPDYPCATILFESAHFETVAILHEIEENIYQAQTVYSFRDPFIQGLIERAEGKKEYNISKKDISPDYSKMSIEEIIKYLTKELGGVLSRDELKKQAKILKNKESSSSGEKKDLKNMTTDEAIEYLHKTTPGWEKMLEKDTEPRDYARQLIKIAKGKSGK